MKRTLDASVFNRIANHPCVRPHLGGEGVLDLTANVENPDNYAFLTPHDDGGYLVVNLQPGLYAAHTLALPSARGRPMLELMRDGFRFMFTATDAVEIVTTCPDSNEAGARWADAAGFRETFRREACFNLNGRTVGASYRSLAYGDWVLRDKRNHREGQEFHDLLASLKPHNHPDDPVHDAWVGATIEGCIRGNICKSIAMYNRWSVQAGYVQSHILSVTPPLVNIGDAVVHLVDDRPHVLRLIGAEGSSHQRIMGEP